MGARNNKVREGRKEERKRSEERKRVPERPTKIVPRPLSNYLAALRDMLKIMIENRSIRGKRKLREILQHVG